MGDKHDGDGLSDEDRNVLMKFLKPDRANSSRKVKLRRKTGGKESRRGEDKAK